MRLLEQYGADPTELARERKLARINRVLAEIDAVPVDPSRGIMTIEDLYDPETGLPR